MQSLELTIDLDRPDARYRPGETVSGRLRVAHGTRSFGRSLVLALRWEARGQGDVDRGAERTLVLAEADADISGGAFPFALEAPLGPLSYTSRTLAIEWLLEARLAVRSLVGEVVTRRIIVEADPDGEPPPLAGDQLESVRQRAQTTLGLPAGAPLDRATVERLVIDKEVERKQAPGPIGCGPLLWVWWLVAALPLAWSAAGEYATFERIMGFVCGGVSLVVVVSMVVSTIRERRARHRLALEVNVSPRVVRPGGSILCTVRVFPGDATEISSIEATLIAQELAYGSDIDGPTRSCIEIHRTTIVMATARRLASSAPETFDARVEIPPDAPGSFESAHNRVDWEVRVTVHVPRFPPLDQQLGLVVHPVNAARAQEVM
jgi:hypothetical protein